MAAALLTVGCQAPTPLPHVPEPPSHKVGRLLFLESVDDDTEICAVVTSAMRFRDPDLIGPVCGLTVGDLRAWLQRQARAN